MNAAFSRHNGCLHAESLPLPQIAERFGTPCYVYSRAAIEQAWLAYDQALAGHNHLICYAVKANPNLAILNILARLGSGFDIVSGGELTRVLRAGGEAAKVVFSGVGKTVAEMEQALEAGILCFNVESAAELDRLAQVAAAHGVRAPVSLRVNPDVDAKTHPYISTGLKENKFGIPIELAADLYRTAAAQSHLQVCGIDCHIGSQLTDATPFADATARVLRLVDELQREGICLEHIDLGGGLGIQYRDEQPPAPQVYAQALLNQLGDRDLQLLIEPGRSIVGQAGVLLTRVEYLKHSQSRNFAIVDAAMNDLMRPSLYNAWQDIVIVEQADSAPTQCYDVVGPVCETGDFLGKDRELALQQGQLLAILASGAYGFSMSSQYNSRPRAAEIMVDGEHAHVIRARETIDDLLRGETLLPE